MKTFKELYLTGECTSTDISKWFEDCPKEYETLAEALGMSSSEYAQWIEDPSKLTSILWCWQAEQVVRSKVSEHLKGSNIGKAYSEMQFLSNLDKLLMKRNSDIIKDAGI